jgi:hypothetical protein
MVQKLLHCKWYIKVLIPNVIETAFGPLVCLFYMRLPLEGNTSQVLL